MRATMEITTKMGCSINCKYCPQKLLLSKYFCMEDHAEMMSFETFKTCVDKIPTDVDIDFAGMCEPYLNPECTKMIEYAVQKGHQIKIFTTLVGMKKEDVEALENIKIKQFVLHVPDKERNSCIDVTDEWLECLKLVNEKGLGQLKALSCHGTIDERADNILSDAWERDYGTLIDRAGNLDNIPEHRLKEDPICCAECGYGMNRNILLPNGTVLLCCMDYGMKHILGNLLRGDYSSIVHGKEAERVVANMKRKNEDIICRHCSNARTIEQITEECINLKATSLDLWIGYTWLNNAYKELQSWSMEQEEGKKWLENCKNEHKKHIKMLESNNSNLEEQQRALSRRLDGLKTEITDLNKQIDGLKNSFSWKLGRAITFVPKKIKTLVRKK